MVIILVEALQRGRVDLNEQVVSCKKITKMSLTLLQSPHHLCPTPWQTGCRYKSNFPPQEPPQLWNLEPESPPYGHPFEPVPTPRSHNHSLSFFIMIVKPNLASKSLVRKLGSQRHGHFFAESKQKQPRKLWEENRQPLFYSENQRLGWLVFLSNNITDGGLVSEAVGDINDDG